MKKILLAGSFLLTTSYAAFAYVPDNEYNAMKALAQVNAGGAYDLGFTGAGITVGVVDSGIDKTHFEFKGKVSPSSYHFLYDKAIFDPESHGTHVSGTIAAARNGIGMHGVAYDSNLLVFGVLGADGKSRGSEDQENAYAFINTRPEVKIVNNSLGVPYSLINDPLSDIKQEYDDFMYNTLYTDDFVMRKASLTKYDKVMVMAAGNEQNFQPSITAAIPYFLPETMGNVVVVVAYDPNGVNYNDKSTFANDEVLSDPYYGGFSNLCGEAKAYCIAAPGVLINSTVPGGGYEDMMGTSMAAPIVSGALALINQAFPGMTGKQLLGAMFENAIKAADIGKNDFTVTREETVGLKEEDGVLVADTVLKEDVTVSFEDAVGQGFLDIGEAVKGPKTFSNNHGGVYSYYSPAKTKSTFRHDISGTDGYTQSGLGEVFFAGNNSYNGATVINGGSLYLSNKTLSSGGVTVANMASFGGSGTVNDNEVLIKSGGTLEVGYKGDYNGLNITNNLISDGGNLVVNIKDANNAKLDVAGNATISGGYVSMGRGSKAIVGQEYQIASLNNFTGSGYVEYKPLYQFSSGSLRQDGDNLYLTLSRSQGIDEINLSPNQLKIAGAYKQIEDNYDDFIDVTSMIYGLNPDNGEAQATLSELGGTIHANQMASRVTQKTSTNIFSRLNRVGNMRMADAFDEVNSFQVAQAYGNPVYFPSYTPVSGGPFPYNPSYQRGYSGNKGGIWAQPFAGYADVKKDAKNNLPSLDTSIFGVQAGADGYIRNNWIMGGTISYGRGQTKQKGSRIDVDDYRIGVYTGAKIKNFDLNGVFTSGYQRYDSERELGLYGLNAKGDYEGYNFDLALDGAYNFYRGETSSLRLIFGVDTMYSRINSFTENGASMFNLAVDGISDTMVDGKIGFGFDKQGADYGFSADVYYKRLFTGYNTDMTAKLMGADDKFKLDGYDYDKNIGGVELSYFYNVNQDTVVYLDVIGEFSSDVKSVAGTAGVRYNF